MAPDEEWISEPPEDAAPKSPEIEDGADLEETTLHRAPKYQIDSYGAAYPVDGLVKRVRSGDIAVAGFQREFVWGKGQSSRFVESLLMGLPVPAIFLAKTDDNRLLIVDGQQRLISLRAFYDGKWPLDDKPFKLTSVGDEFIGKTYQTLTEVDRRQLDNAVIHSIILKPESESNEAIYFIFERINTGGTRLNRQEIREAIEMGDLIELIYKINDNPAWRTLFGPFHRRAKDRELVLRFLALVHHGTNYEKPMLSFLNRFAHTHRKMSPELQAEMSKLFDETMTLILKAVGPQAFKPQKLFNAPAYEAVSATVGRALRQGARVNPEKLKEAVAKLYADSEFQHAAFDRTMNAWNVTTRFDRAQSILGVAIDGPRNP